MFYYREYSTFKFTVKLLNLYRIVKKNDGFNGIHANGATVTQGVSVNYAFDICGQDDICSRAVVKV